VYAVVVIVVSKRERSMLRFRWLIIVVGLIFSNQIFAQSELDEFNPYFKVSTAYVIGGQVYNDNFLYNPGYSIQVSHGYNIAKDIQLGVGSGFMDLKNQNFVPVFLEITGDRKKKKNAPIIKFQGGYSFAGSNSTVNLPNYDLDGGIYFNMGLGRRIKIKDSYSLLLEWSYCHQSSKMEYSLFSDNSHSEAMNFDFIMLTVGILIR
jgi:hypothetical protein